MNGDHEPESVTRARADLEAARRVSAQLRTTIAASQDTLSRLSRNVAVDDPRLDAASIEQEEQLRSLQDALARERAAEAAFNDAIGANLTADGTSDVAKLAADFPIVLLPVRLETRFAKDATGATSLKVRIYPDELMANTHEPPLTEAERNAGITYWRRGWQPENEKDAWRQLVVAYPAPRAAWIVRSLTPINIASRPAGTPAFPATESRVSSWTRAPETRVLPDRWLVVGYREGREVLRSLGGPIQEPLALGLSPAQDGMATISVTADGLKLDEALAWTVDFERAVGAGMALTIPASPIDLSLGFDRLVVLGVKSSMTPDEAASQLSLLFDGHHYTNELAFLPQGTPTNNTTAAPSAFPPKDTDGATSFAVERGESLAGPDSNGTLFARALGLPAEIISHIAASDLVEQPNAHAMNEALWPLTWRYFLDQMMDPVADDNAIELTRKYFVDHVRGRGPLPAFRVGKTPYGLLPVSSLTRWTSTPAAGPAETQLVPLLRNLRNVWTGQVAQVPRMGATDDPDADLLAVLGLDASTREVRARTVLGPDVQNQLFTVLNIPTVTWLSKQRLIIQQLMTQLGHSEWNPRIGKMTFADAAKLVRLPFVADALSETEALQPFNYINWIRNATVTQLQQEQLPQGVTKPNALLYLLLRHAALSLYAGVATKVAIENGLVARADRIEPEVVAAVTRTTPATQTHLTSIQRLNQEIPHVTGVRTLGEFVRTEPSGAGDSSAEINDFQAALAQLENLPTAELDRLLTETLDTCSHRLDAWITSLASKRLDEMRVTKPQGVHLGAFAWVEDLRPDTTASGTESAAEGGFVHAPSASHAATAAILRNAYLTRSGANRERYAIDLSSARVRAALDLLDAVRQGQPLGAVLGYRFERGMHEGHLPVRLDKYIDPFRQLYSLVADKGGVSGEPTETIAARNVVDGLLLRAAWQSNTIPWGQSGLPVAGMDRTEIEKELGLLDDAVDAVADLLLSESVFQLVRGNASKAASVLDAVGQGLRPPEPEIAIQPRAGTTLTQRVGIILGGKPVAAHAWSQVPLTPRARVEPYLDRWVGRLFGDPTKIQCVLRYNEGGTRIFQTITLSELKLRPLDLLALARNLDAFPMTSELDARIAAVAPETATNMEIIYSGDPTWDRSVIRTFSDILQLGRSINALLAKSRALDPKDLLPQGESQLADGADRLPNESAERAGKAEADLKEARDQLQSIIQGSMPDPAILRAALGAAALFGIPGAWLARDGGEAERDTLMAQANVVLTELNRRSSAAAATDDSVKKVQALFGQEFVFLPRFHCANPGELGQALTYGPTLVSDSNAVIKWMQQASRVRAPLTNWRRLSLLAGVLNQPLSLSVAQLPHVPTARWVGSPFASEDERPDSGCLSLVMHQASAIDATAPWAGLLVDEWNELIPARKEDTSIAFHYDDAGAEAAQTVLVAVPPTQSTQWDLEALLDTLNETFDLAKIRAVDSDLLPLGQILPVIYMASNPSNDTVSTNLHGVLADVSLVHLN